jgi:hypothetical protein
MSAPDPRTILSYIVQHEAGPGSQRGQGVSQPWDVVNNQAYRFVPPPRPVSQMTIGEVKDWQRQTLRAQAAAGLPQKRRSSAAGGPQFLLGTLEGLQRNLGIPDSARFDQATQERMAIHLMREKGLDDFQAGRITADRFANNLAHVWAALPLVSGPNRGRGVYDAPGFNQSTGRADEWFRVVSGGQLPPQITMSARNMPDGTGEPPGFSEPVGRPQPRPAQDGEKSQGFRPIARLLHSLMNAVASIFRRS